MKNGLVVVTGAGGFIGGALVSDLRRRGFTKIRAVDVKPLEEWYQVSDGVENLVLDLNLKDHCDAVSQGAQQVFNLAANMGGMGFIENNKALCMLSVLINTHMLEAARNHGVQRFFYSSSACVYNGDKQKDVKNPGLKEEDAYPALAEDGYGWEKLFQRADVPALPRGFRHRDARGAVPQRVRPAGHLGRRPGEGSRGHLPQGDRGQAEREL